MTADNRRRNPGGVIVPEFVPEPALRRAVSKVYATFERTLVGRCEEMAIIATDLKGACNDNNDHA